MCVCVCERDFGCCFFLEPWVFRSSLSMHGLLSLLEKKSFKSRNEKKHVYIYIHTLNPNPPPSSLLRSSLLPTTHHTPTISHKNTKNTKKYKKTPSQSKNPLKNFEQSTHTHIKHNHTFLNKKLLLWGKSKYHLNSTQLSSTPQSSPFLSFPFSILFYSNSSMSDFFPLGEIPLGETSLGR